MVAKKIVFFAKRRFFIEKTVCKYGKICYNKVMKNTNANKNKTKNGKNTSKQTEQGAFKALLDKPTRENSSGFAFSFAAMFMFGLNFVALLVLSWSGVDFERLKETPPDWYLYLCYVLPPIALFFVAIWYFNRTKKSVAETLKKQKCHFKYYLLALALQVGLLSLSFSNTLFAEFLQSLGYTLPKNNIPSLDGFGIVGAIFVIAVLPAVFEEIIFRGVVLDGAYAYGTAGAALLCGGLFALYHQNPEQTIYQFCWGAAFALMAIRAGSILPTMLAHFINNATILLLQRFLPENTKLNLPLPVFIPVIIISALCLIGTLFYLIFVDKNRLQDEGAGDSAKEKKTKRGVFILGAMIGVLICFVNWASALYTGFTVS